MYQKKRIKCKNCGKVCSFGSTYDVDCLIYCVDCHKLYTIEIVVGNQRFVMIDEMTKRPLETIEKELAEKLERSVVPELSKGKWQTKVAEVENDLPDLNDDDYE